MNTFFIILSVLAIVLIAVGTSQREAINLWFKSETSAIISNNINTTKVAKYQLKDMKAKIVALVDQAAAIYALEITQQKQCEVLKANSTQLLKEAKDAKESNNPTLAKEKLKLKKETDQQVILITENIATLIKNRQKLEGNIQKVKTYVAKQDIQLQGVIARKQVNDLLKSSSVANIDGNTLDETIDNIELDVVKDELKLEYIDSTSDIIVEDYSDEIDKEYDSI